MERIIKSDQGRVTGSQGGNKDSCLEYRRRGIEKGDMCMQQEHPGQVNQVDDVGRGQDTGRGDVQLRPESGQPSGEL